MKHILSLFIVLSLFTLSSYAGHDIMDHGARSAAMAGADVALKDFWSLRNNQAGLAYLDGISFGLYYENRFGLDELAYQSFGFAVPTSRGTLAATANYYGNEDYHESALGLAYGVQLLENLSIGIQLDYLSTYANTVPEVNYQAITFEGGILYDISDDIVIGVHLYNPLEVEMESDVDTEIVPAAYSVGSVITLSDGLLVSAEMQKVMDRRESFRIGAEYEVVKKTFLRAGVGTHPGIFSFGFETAWKKVQLQIAASNHEVLGFSPMVSLIVNL